MIQAVLWFAVAMSATIAVYSSLVHDTLAERIALALVAFTTGAAAVRAWNGTYTASGDLSLAIGLAIYAIVIVFKNTNKINPPLPSDKCRH
jgi:hypothetical protein